MRNLSRRSFLRAFGAVSVVAGASMMTGCSLIRFVNVEIAIADDSAFSQELSERFAAIDAELGSFELPLPGIVSQIRVTKFENGPFKTLDTYLDNVIKNALRDTEPEDVLEDYKVCITNRTKNGYFKITQDGFLIIEVGIYKKDSGSAE